MQDAVSTIAVADADSRSARGVERLRLIWRNVFPFLVVAVLWEIVARLGAPSVVHEPASSGTPVEALSDQCAAAPRGKVLEYSSGGITRWVYLDSDGRYDCDALRTLYF